MYSHESYSNFQLGSAAVGTQNLVVLLKSHGSIKEQIGNVNHIQVYDKHKHEIVANGKDIYTYR
jgi:hypothetical protein